MAGNGAWTAHDINRAAELSNGGRESAAGQAAQTRRRPGQQPRSGHHDGTKKPLAAPPQSFAEPSAHTAATDQPKLAYRGAATLSHSMFEVGAQDQPVVPAILPGCANDSALTKILRELTLQQYSAKFAAEEYDEDLLQMAAEHDDSWLHVVQAAGMSQADDVALRARLLETGVR